MPKWYWVQIRKEWGGWEKDSEKMWAKPCSLDETLFYVFGRDDLVEKESLIFHKGPVTEEDIETAYFGYWV